MRIHTVLAAAAMLAASSGAYAQNGAPNDAGACLAKAQAVDTSRVGPAGPGDVNKGMQAAQEQEAIRLQTVARQQAEAGDAQACWRTLGLMEDLIAENRQQLPTQQELATGQPGSPALDEAVEEAVEEK